MLRNLPRWLWTLIWVLVAILLIILIAWIIHLIGGGMLDVRLGHFIFRIGVT